MLPWANISSFIKQAACRCEHTASASRRVQQSSTAGPSVPRTRRNKTDGFVGDRAVERKSKTPGVHSYRYGADQSSSRQLLDPFVLAKRLRHLSNSERLDEALDILYKSPRDAVNVVVWNTMISCCLTRHQVSKVFRLYYEVSMLAFFSLYNLLPYHFLVDATSRISPQFCDIHDHTLRTHQRQVMGRTYA